MDTIGIAGLLVSIAGFAISLWQLARTRRAAEAALAASLDTAHSIRFVNALTDIEEICGRSRELLHLTRGENLGAAATAAFELRDHVAKFHATKVGLALATPSAWKVLRERIGVVHDQLEWSAIRGRLDNVPRQLLLREIAQTHEQLCTLSATTMDFGGKYADPN